jgi:DnaJ family protein C protein 3
LIFLGAIGDVNDHLEKGKRLLATGQLADALTHFHSAIGRMKYV